MPIPWNRLSHMIGIDSCPESTLALGACSTEAKYAYSPDDATAAIAFRYTCDNYATCNVEGLIGTGTSAAFQIPLQSSMKEANVCDDADKLGTTTAAPTEAAPTTGITVPAVSTRLNDTSGREESGEDASSAQFVTAQLWLAVVPAAFAMGALFA